MSCTRCHVKSAAEKAHNIDCPALIYHFAFRSTSTKVLSCFGRYSDVRVRIRGNVFYKLVKNWVVMLFHINFYFISSCDH